MAKRLFDLFGAALGLGLLSPLLLLVALWIRLDSPGPALFRQERVGRRGVVFQIHKFRTMVKDAPALGLPLTVGADPRITRAGGWLRKHRVDELPQLIDVLLGHMSLVGPRPEVSRWVTSYPPGLRERILAVRPGITDPSSLNFIDEGAMLAAVADPEREYVDNILPRKLQQSADYAEQATLLSDLGVMARTLAMLVRPRPGAPE